MRSTLTLFEYEYTQGFDWSNRDLIALERMNSALGTEVLRARIRNGRVELQASQHVGVVRLGRRSVQILPKVHRNLADNGAQDKAREAMRNLLHMLRYAGQLPVREHEITAMTQQDCDWFEILIKIFCSHLTEEWQRGVSKQYQTVENESPSLRGKWRIGEQLRHPDRKHVFSVAYDDFTADNMLNRLFRYVVERLWLLTRDADNRQQLGVLRQWMDEVQLLSSLSEIDISSMILTRLNKRYQPLLNLARLFLTNQSMQLSIGDLDSFSFVLDMNQLYEAFLTGFIVRHQAKILPSELAGCQILPQTRGASLHLARRDKRDVFRLRPDLAFRSQNGEFPLLVDAKYKRLDESDKQLGISQSDFYQMFTYSYRFKCPRVLMIYPRTEGMSSFTSLQIKGCESSVSVATIDLMHDLGSASGRSALIAELYMIFREATDIEAYNS